MLASAWKSSVHHAKWGQYIPLKISALTLYPLTWRIRWAPNNASKGQMVFNWAFGELSCDPMQYQIRKRYHLKLFLFNNAFGSGLCASVTWSNIGLSDIMTTAVKTDGVGKQDSKSCPILKKIVRVGMAWDWGNNLWWVVTTMLSILTHSAHSYRQTLRNFTWFIFYSFYLKKCVPVMTYRLYCCY
jgi:hypothetical protein